MTDYVRLTDADLLARCLNRDAEAWETLLRRYQRLIASITYKFALPAEDAADVFQAVWMALHQQLSTIRQPEMLRAWLIKVAVRECWKCKGRWVQTESLDDPSRENSVEPVDPAASAIDESLVEAERQYLLRRAVEQLPDPCRRLIEHLFYREPPTPYAELAGLLGMPVASVGPTRGRCLAKLREILGQSEFQ